MLENYPHLVKAGLVSFVLYYSIQSGLAKDTLGDGRLFFSNNDRDRIDSELLNNARDESVLENTDIGSVETRFITFNGFVLGKKKMILWINGIPWIVLYEGDINRYGVILNNPKVLWEGRLSTDVRLPASKKLPEVVKNEVVNLAWYPQAQELMIVLADQSKHNLKSGFQLIINTDTRNDLISTIEPVTLKSGGLPQLVDLQ